MKDIIEQLRWHCTCAWRGVSVPCIACKSAHEIQRLRELTDALQVDRQIAASEADHG